MYPWPACLLECWNRFIWVPPCLFSTHPGPGEHHVPCFLRNACWLTTGEGGGGGKEGWGWSKSPCPTTSSGYSPASSIIADPHSLWMSRYNATWLRNQRSQCSPLPPLTPLPPPPPCQKPPPPWSLFIISVGCDLPKRGAVTISHGDPGQMGWWDRK